MIRTALRRIAFGVPAVALSVGVAAAQNAATTPASNVAAKTNSTGKKVLTPADYTKWRAIDGSQISSDGKWVSYGLRFTNVLPADAKPVLHIRDLGTDKEIEIPNASNASWSPDAKWVVYQVDSIPAAGGRGGRGGGAQAPAAQAGRGGAGAPAGPARRFELRNLVTGRTQTWQDVQAAVFAPTSTHLVLRRRGPGVGGGGGGRGGAGGGGGGPGGDGGAALPTGPRGSDAILVELATGRTQLLGSVGDIAFNRKGELLAYTVDATIKDGNGLFVIDLSTGATHTIENDTRSYSRLAWNDAGTSLAALKGNEVPRMRDRDNQLIVINDVRAAFTGTATPVKLDPASATGFPKGFVVTDRAPLAWSEDNQKVFLSIIGQSAVPDTGRRASTDSTADVDIWRTEDDRIQSQQMIRANADRNFSFREAFVVSGAKYVTLTDSSMRDIELSTDSKWAIGRDVRAYISDYARPAADFYRVNTATGERKLMFKNQLTGQHAIGLTPDGKQFIFWKDSKYQAYDVEAGTTKTLAPVNAPSFVDMEFDHPGPRPSYGFLGVSSDAKSVIVEGKFDIWQLPFDGSAAKNLTNGVGTKSEIKFLPIRTEPLDSSATRRERSNREIDISKPVTLSAYGEYTKKAGFYELNGSDLKELVFEDAAFGRPTRATKANKYLFTRETFAIFPDLHVSTAGFKDAKKISDANPQQAEFAWGRRVLFDFKNKQGRRLQGIIGLPEDYKQGEKRPMIVNFYEKNSQNLHRYSSPSYITGMGSSPVEAISRGYITMIPDIWFNTGSSHSDMLDCVEAATKKAIEMGYADPKHIGVNGHSYGGEGAAFIGTRSRMFAAVAMGAGVTDLFTDFNQSWGWSYQVQGGSGANGNDYYLYGQGRWGFSPWDKPEVYHFESALTHVPEATAPFLMMHGTADPTVSFSEGMNFYNALRYNKKEAVLLAYPGEGHGLSGLANRRDLTVRFFEFYDHFLKGTPAPKWMTDGVPFLVKDTKPTPTPVPTVVP